MSGRRNGRILEILSFSLGAVISRVGRWPQAANYQALVWGEGEAGLSSGSQASLIPGVDAGGRSKGGNWGGGVSHGRSPVFRPRTHTEALR